MRTVTREEMVQAQVTPEIASEWTDWYRDVITETPQNPSARGRAELMDHIAGLVSEDQS